MPGKIGKIAKTISKSTNKVKQNFKDAARGTAGNELFKEAVKDEKKP